MTESVSIGVAVLCFAVAMALHIGLEVGDVSLGAAFAPVLVVVARSSGANTVAIALAAGGIGAAVAGAHSRSWSVLPELPALAASVVVMWCAERLARQWDLPQTGRPVLLFGGGLAVIVYSLLADGAKHVRGRAVPSADRRVWVLLQAVLVSAYGLMALVYHQIGWPAVGAMLVLLAITKREFDRYAKARRTLAQTVAALSSLETVSLP